MKAVCIGDSLTFGYGVLRTERWCEIVKKELGIELSNRGINGDTTAGMLSRSFKDIAKSKAEVAIIMGGTNDFMSGRKVDSVYQNIKAIYDEAVDYNIIPIIAIQPMVIEGIAIQLWDTDVDYIKVNDCIKNYRKLIIDDETISYIDIYKAIEELCSQQSKKEYFIDGIHLTAKGHTVIAKLVIDKLTNIRL